LTICKVKFTINVVVLSEGSGVGGMEGKPKRIKYYRTADGKIPFIDWFGCLRNLTTKDEIRSRLNRLKLGNYGDCKSVGDGVSELRFRSGMRIYFTEIADIMVLLFCGGNKGTQKSDIEKAKFYWKDFKFKAKAGGK
jgi:putative addiction module killer protein